MAAVRRTAQRARERGFSMVEMLLAALILAVGILGLTMLQAMGLRYMRGSHNLTLATQLAEQTLDQVEQEGRSTWLNATDSPLAAPRAVPGLLYFAAGSLFRVVQDYDGQGNPTAGNGVFTCVAQSALVPGATVGGLVDVTATVTFQEAGQGGALATRSVVVSRRIVHG
jgi:prepilin-type N-terminal cleavage/methylation domain-containing protein